MPRRPDRYSHGHHESVLRSHQWRTVANSAAFLVPYLAPGQALLDLGCGPGTITRELAQLVSPGRVIGVDRAAEVIDEARRAATDAANLTFEVGDAYSLAFDDASFDVVYAHQVLQHLTDPVAAAAETRRVLAPGGLLAARDADYGAFVWDPPDPRLDRWLELYHDITGVNGADADAGRHLPGWIRDAGFSLRDVTSSTWTFHTPEERAWWGGLWADRVRHSEFAAQGLEYGLTSFKELQGMADAFLEWARAEDGLFVVVHVEVIAAA